MRSSVSSTSLLGGAEAGRAELQLVDRAPRHLGRIVVVVAYPQYVRPRRQVLRDVEANEHDHARDREQPDHAADNQPFLTPGAALALPP